MAIKNPFNFSDQYENPNRNTFDISYQNNVTFNLGKIVPIQCMEVLPNTTVSFDTTLGLSFMPLIFPVQTRMRAEVKSFYVRNRTLWKDWKDFIGLTKDGLVPPYLAKNTSIKTGSLSDYLGISTTLYGASKRNFKQPFILQGYTNVQTNSEYFGYNISDSVDSTPPIIVCDELQSIKTSYTNNNSLNALFNTIRNAYLSRATSFEHTANAKKLPPIVNDKDIIFNDVFPIINNEFKLSRGLLDQLYQNDSDLTCAFYINGRIYPDIDSHYYPLLSGRYFNSFKNPRLAYRYKDGESIRISFATLDISSGGNLFLSNSNVPQNFDTLDILDCLVVFNINTKSVFSFDSDKQTYSIIFNQYGLDSFKTDIDTGLPTEHLEVISPYYDKDTNPDGETLTCLAHRAYESIYNYWYRDSRNNPRIVNGEPVYNSFITTDAGGEDDTDYHLFDDNWEQDFLTTAVQSPQQGIAPLVGITSYGEFTFKDEDGNHYSAQATFGSDGDTITGFSVLSPDMPPGNRRQLVDMASYGISISDLRNVNALQRWLEINMRRGLRYQDQLKSHFGVDVKYKDYMYPEFIGGHNEEIFIKEVDQTVPTNETPLGWKAGQATSFGKSRNRVTHFCDEHGFIITCIVVKPVANYSQLVPKHFYKKDTLDYFFPEFGHLSMQAIPYREVAPIQAVNEFGIPKLKETFGYQRAWYEYFNKTDEVHGLFRNNLRNFVVQRQFTSLPELSNDFLTIHNDELDDIFAVSSSDVDHKIIGQIYFDYQIKLPIPKYGVQRLEA